MTERYSDVKERIHQTIAKIVSSKLIGNIPFNTWDLSQEIYMELERKGLLELATLAYLNRIVIDLMPEGCIIKKVYRIRKVMKNESNRYKISGKL
jgi:hypothetical protein